MGLDIQDAQSPRSKGSDLIDTNCRENTSGLCGRSSCKEDFPSVVSVAFRGLLSDISASTLKGRQDTCAARFSGRGASTSSSVENSSLQSPGERMLSFISFLFFFFFNPEIAYPFCHGVQTCSVHTMRNSELSCYKVAKVVLGKKTFGRFSGISVRARGWGKTCDWTARLGLWMGSLWCHAPY